MTYSVLHICSVSLSRALSKTLLCPACILGTHSMKMQRGMSTVTSGLKSISTALCTVFHFGFLIRLNSWIRVTCWRNWICDLTDFGHAFSPFQMRMKIKTPCFDNGLVITPWPYTISPSPYAGQQMCRTSAEWHVSVL